MTSSNKDTKLVYSTGTGDLRKAEDKKSSKPQAKPQDAKSSNVPAGTVLVRLDTKARRGKAVTLITGIPHNPQVIEKIGKDLKALCGAGGTVENKEILIQGDHRDKVCEKLQALGLKVNRR